MANTKETATSRGIGVSGLLWDFPVIDNKPKK